ncbi:MAG: DUF481 domain-containing protein [Chlorobiaceae bacterium]|nr:DUF481 domain-containing protein [Chlorobiaceae bacterium]
MSASPHHRLAIALCTVLLMSAPPAIGAQTIVLDNGDRLTGTVLRMSDGILQFRTDYAGTIGIDWKKVREIRSEEPMKIRLTGNGTIPVKSLNRNETNLLLDNRIEPAFNLTQINPDDWETGKAARITGEINLALKLDRGNTHENRINLSSNLEWKKLTHRVRLAGEIEYDKTNNIETLSRRSIETTWDSHFSKNLYYGATTSFKTNRITALDHRWSAGPYAGWNLFGNNRTRLSAETGLEYTSESYHSRATQYFLSDAWRMDFSHFVIPGKVEIYHRNKGLLSLAKEGGLTFDSWTGIKIPIAGGLQTSAEFKTGYNSNAPVGNEPWDTTWRMRLGYRW